MFKMDLEQEVEKMIEESAHCKEKFLQQTGKIAIATEKIVECFKRGDKLLIFGNGGSAADAQHFAAELMGRYKLERRAFPAIALTTDTSFLTAWANDYNFNTIFERQVEGLAKNGDVLVGISTSGKSKDVYLGLKKGREIGTTNISLTGNNGGALVSLSDVNINCYSTNTPRIQECHVLAYHIICELVEKEMEKYDRRR